MQHIRVVASPSWTQCLGLSQSLPGIARALVLSALDLSQLAIARFGHQGITTSLVQGQAIRGQIQGSADEHPDSMLWLAFAHLQVVVLLAASGQQQAPSLVQCHAARSQLRLKIEAHS